MFTYRINRFGGHLFLSDTYSLLRGLYSYMYKHNIALYSCPSSFYLFKTVCLCLHMCIFFSFCIKEKCVSKMPSWKQQCSVSLTCVLWTHTKIVREGGKTKTGTLHFKASEW